MKLKDKYLDFYGKYQDIQRRLHKEGDVPTLKEELKKNDEEMIMVMERFIILEGALRKKEEELKLSKGM